MPARSKYFCPPGFEFAAAASLWFSRHLRFRFHLPEPGLGLKLRLVIKLIMSNVGKESSSANDLLKNSTLYREFQAEREEILRPKWIESEKAGHDIGFERALTDWIIRHRASWRKTRQVAGRSEEHTSEPQSR